MALCDIDEILANACTNRFSCVRSEAQQRAILLQLLCDLAAGGSGGGGVGGTVELGSAIDSGTVSGLGLSAVPDSVVLTMQVPSGGLLIYPSLVGDPTADGFTFQLNSPTDSADYVLHYVVVP